MLDIKFIRANPDQVKQALKGRGVAERQIDQLLKIDEQRRKLLSELENLNAEQNKFNKEIKGKPKPGVVKKMKALKNKIRKLETDSKKIDDEFNQLMLALPNLPRLDVKVGESDKDNEIIRTEGKKTEFNFKPLDYLTLAEKLDLIDIPRAAKIVGARFAYLKNNLVLLEFALIRLAFDTLIKNGFKPILPPLMVKPEIEQALGYRAAANNEAYQVNLDNLFLIGTAEHAVAPMHQDEILAGENLPLRYAAFSSCFRREAGSYGQDTKGIKRVHQFDKAEMVSFTKPDDSDKEHEFLLSMAEGLVKKLKIPYRVVRMCTGDLAAPSARTYDIECWLPSQQKYMETHSISTCTDYQARRLNIKYQDQSTKKKDFVHILNGTGYAIGRILIAIMENYQTKKGTIEVPKVLQDYCGFDEIE